MTKSTPILKIETGIVNLDIERDGEIVGTLSFNPLDALFSERFYQMVREFQARKNAGEEETKSLDAKVAKNASDADNIPDSLEDTFNFEKDLCEFCDIEIDKVFGEGTCKLVFAGVRNIYMYLQFIEGITKYFEEKRKPIAQKYSPESVFKKEKRSRK